MKSLFKRIVVILISSGIFYVIAHYMGISTSFESIRVAYDHSLAVIISVMFGPIVDAFSGEIGQTLTQLMELTPDWISVGCTVLNTGLIGFLMRKNDINNGFFYRKEAISFTRAQTLCNFAVWGVLSPVLNILIVHAEFQQAVLHGLRIAFNNSVSCMLVASLFLSIYARSRISELNFYLS